MTDIKSIFKSIDEDPRLNDLNATPMLIARLVASRSVVSLIIAVSKRDKKRHLFIALAEKLSQEELKQLPSWYGIDIEQELLSILDLRNTWFLILSHANDSDKNIFETIICSICEELLTVSDKKIMLGRLTKILDKWKHFFTLHSSNGLSQVEQQGLYGELWFLRELIDFSHNPSCIKNWIGFKKVAHDFQYKNCCVEVKTTIGKKPYSARINSENQLDDRNIDKLYLVFLAIHPMHDSGEKLPDIINQLRNRTAEHTDLHYMLDENLFMAGYIDSQAYLYSKGYSVREMLSYNVCKGFPRILHDEVSNGVGDISYSIQLAACEDYRIPVEDILSHITSLQQGE